MSEEPSRLGLDVISYPLHVNRKFRNVKVQEGTGLPQRNFLCEPLCLLCVLCEIGFNYVAIGTNRFLHKSKYSTPAAANNVRHIAGSILIVPSLTLSSRKGPSIESPKPPPKK